MSFKIIRFGIRFGVQPHSLFRVLKTIQLSVNCPKKIYGKKTQGKTVLKTILMNKALEEAGQQKDSLVAKSIQKNRSALIWFSVKSDQGGFLLCMIYHES